MHEYKSVVEENKGNIKALISQKDELKLEIAETRVITNDTKHEIEKIDEINRKLLLKLDKKDLEAQKLQDDIQNYHNLLDMVHGRIQHRQNEHK